MFTPASLTVPAVFTKLREIATMTGNSVSIMDCHHRIVSPLSKVGLLNGYSGKCLEIDI